MITAEPVAKTLSSVNSKVIVPSGFPILATLQLCNFKFKDPGFKLCLNLALSTLIT